MGKERKIKKSICRSKSIKGTKIIRLMEKKNQMNVALVDDKDVIHKSDEIVKRLDRYT